MQNLNYFSPEELTHNLKEQGIFSGREQLHGEQLQRYDTLLTQLQRQAGQFVEQAVRFQALPISEPDPVPKPWMHRRKARGKKEGRTLTAAELADIELHLEMIAEEA